MKKTIFAMFLITIVVFTFKYLRTLSLNGDVIPSTISSESKTTIKLDEHLRPVERLSKVISHVRYLYLEETPESLIGDISRIVVKDDRIYIQDQVSQKLVAFNSNGEFIFSINRKGDGPGEYNRLTKFDIDEQKNEIVIASDYKLMWFDIQGNFLREVKTPYAGAIDMQISNDSKIFLYTSYLPLAGKEDNHFNLYEVSESGKILAGYLPIDAYDINHESLLGLFSSFSQTSNNEILLTRAYSNNILGISKELGVYVKYQFDFGDKNLPSDYEFSSLKDHSLSLERRLDLEKSNGHIRLSGGPILESDSYVHFSFNYNGDRYYSFFNKENESISFVYSTLTQNDIDGSGYFINLYATRHEFISFTYPSVLLANPSHTYENNQINDLKSKLPPNAENPILRFISVNKME